MAFYDQSAQSKVRTPFETNQDPAVDLGVGLIELPFSGLLSGRVNFSMRNQGNIGKGKEG